MESKGFSKAQNTEESTKAVRERVFFPHVDAILEAYQKHFGGKEAVDQSELEALREVFYSYLEQRVEKTSIFTSEKLGASFAYSVTDTASLAKELYKKFTKNTEFELNKRISHEAKEEKDFMFVGGFTTLQAGNEYASQEEVMHRMITEVTSALEDIRQGKEPKKKEIYTLASPTNELGKVSKKFADEINETNAADQFGLLYAEFIAKILQHETNEKVPLALYFNGVSMGAGFAVQTADKLIDSGVVTQSSGESSSVPSLQVRIDIPPGQTITSEKYKKIKVTLGFVKEAIGALIKDPYIRKVIGLVGQNDAKFISSKNEVLAEKGIIKNISDEQKKLKMEIIAKVINNLMSGVSIPENVKVTEIIGENDPLMSSGEFSKKVKEQRSKFDARRPFTGESLGENIVSKERNLNRRTFGIQTTHKIPFLDRNNEYQRLQKLARSLESIRHTKENNG